MSRTRNTADLVSLNAINVSGGNVGIGTDANDNRIYVEGDARITGILTVGTASITLDPNAKTLTGLEELQIGSGNTAITIKKSEITGEIEFADTNGKESSIGIGTTVSINTSGIVTATSFSGSLATSDLTGTITNAQLAGSIADDKLSSTFLKNTVEDTTPQLGGNLDINSNYITGTGGINVSGVVTATSFTGGITGNVTGNADTATALASARTIAGVSFDGTSNISLNNNAITNGAGYITTSFVNTNQLVNGAGFITASDDITGNADTATQLETARNIGGVSFNGTADINLPGVNAAGNQNTSGTAANLSGSPSITVTDITAVGNVSIAGTLTASAAFYMPQYTTTARDAASFNEGAMIYNTTTKKMEFYNGSSWQSLPGMSLGLTVALDG